MITFEKPTYVSIHAPVEERPFCNASKLKKTGFNSRSHEGATITDAVEILVFHVSIHAPLRERPSQSSQSIR